VNWANLADIIKTVGHPVRLQIVAILCQRDENVGALAKQVGVRHSSISQQLSILRMRGLVSRRHVSGHAVYTLEEPGLRSLIACMMQSSFRRLKSVDSTGVFSESQHNTASNGQGGNQ
jgi:DNA-binding transcriptional ArsR family regulator